MSAQCTKSQLTPKTLSAAAAAAQPRSRIVLDGSNEEKLAAGDRSYYGGNREGGVTQPRSCPERTPARREAHRTFFNVMGRTRCCRVAGLGRDKMGINVNKVAFKFQKSPHRCWRNLQYYFSHITCITYMYFRDLKQSALPADEEQFFPGSIIVRTIRPIYAAPLKLRDDGGGLQPELRVHGRFALELRWAIFLFK